MTVRATVNLLTKIEVPGFRPIRRQMERLNFDNNKAACSLASPENSSAFFRRSTRCGFCPSDIRSFEELLKTSDEQLFGKIIHNRHRVLYKHLPPPSSASQNYDLRPPDTQ